MTDTRLLFLLLIGQSKSVGCFHWTLGWPELRLQTQPLLKTNMNIIIFIFIIIFRLIEVTVSCLFRHEEEELTLERLYGGAPPQHTHTHTHTHTGLHGSTSVSKLLFFSRLTHCMLTANRANNLRRDLSWIRLHANVSRRTPNTSVSTLALADNPERGD